MTLRRINWALILLLVGFTGQQFFFTTPITPIRLYMILIVVAVCVISVSLLFGKTFVIKLTLIDYALVGLYVYMIFTSLYAEDKNLAFQMVLGIIFLLAAYFVIRITAYQFSLDEFFNQLVIVAKVFFIWSFCWYIIGTSLHYVFKFPLVFETSDAAQVVLYGTYYEGGVVPRFRGICNSPNNFGMYALLFGPILFSHAKSVSKWLKVIVFLSVLLTFSFTTYLAVISACIIIAFRKSLLWSYKFSPKSLIAVIIFSSLVFIGLIYIISSPLSQAIFEFIEFRTSRAQTGSGRFELFAFSVDLLHISPVFGEGLNQARLLLMPLRELKSTHNNFLEVMLEGGVFGLAFYLFLIFSLLFCLFDKSCSVKNKNWIKSTLIGMFIFSNANVTLYADSLILSIAIISTTVSYSIRKRNENE